MSLPLIRRNGGLERILQKFPLNPHNIFINLPVNVTANLEQPTPKVRLDRLLSAAAADRSFFLSWD